ncbi:MAG: hypothetical protein COB67_02930 [SAR324 cluster bacterium]|uniref:Serine aminopeptidase S33 domain-containing protein n=1 Tax=SAR324 cluster bacterium TaxID=2024889 RepID=A0A2A4T8B3_9DELT|nr:MAG: hypothetical protein COB67_02930 [SAR324 cluster bacterium]
MILKIGYSLLSCLLLLIVMLLLFQHKLIYHPRPYDARYESFRPGQVIELQYQTGEGQQHAYYIPPQSGARQLPAQLWILFGGNAMLALDWSDFIRNYPGTNIGFLLIDYPGYGKNQGTAWPDTILESSIGAYQELLAFLETTAENMTPRLGILGHSLGAGAALQFANQVPARKVILTAPFTSLSAMAKLIVGWPLCNLVQKDFNNEQQLRQLLHQQPLPTITIFHGHQDEIIPIEMGRQLSALSPRQITFIEIFNSDHNSLIFHAQNQIYSSMMP